MLIVGCLLRLIPCLPPFPKNGLIDDNFNTSSKTVVRNPEVKVLTQQPTIKGVPAAQIFIRRKL